MRGTCPMAKIGQHFVGMLWTQKEHISGARRYVQHARPGGHIEERPLAVAQAEPTSGVARKPGTPRSEEHTSELQSLAYLVCRLLLEKKKKHKRCSYNTVSRRKPLS